MSQTVFNKVDYDLGSLVKYISLGEIGLPDIQRPFVWKNAKVRDLFDSMYKGYPVGYLLFWQNGEAAGSRTIGAEHKQKPPRLVIVDGQQRLTSLYAVLKAIPVVRENYSTERIFIAFNPIDERFEVADAAIQRDRTYIPDISQIWSEQTDLFDFVDAYLAGLAESRELSEEDTKRIKKAITRIHSLTSFPFTALELAASISEEDVSDVFVRINGQGTPLDQADFVLTLMSVFWDEGRAQLEAFCRASRTPSKGLPSPYNHYIEPKPDQLLRACVGVAFKRGRLKHVYSILRGKDLETERFSEERRVQQFDVLKAAQSRVLNLQYWHDFMNCIRQAGYRNGAMITSKNNLLFSYILYLIGRTEYRIDDPRLRPVIARWFFMSNVTGRYTSSPESAMEFDLARFREVTDGEQFIGILENACNVTLTSDFWKVTLPNDLATSSAQSPSLFAHHAALVLLDARALFSKVRISDLLDPSVRANRAAAERHHLFPKDYLKSIGITSTREINQTANYALVEWGDNSWIEASSPLVYLPEIKKRFRNDELAQMYHWHALPPDWEIMDYKEFLERRRELIAGVIEEGYRTLCGELTTHPIEEPFDLSQVVLSGESEAVEFKSTLRTNLHTGNADSKIEYSVLKTVAGFLNANGGALIIGVADDGNSVGTEVDGFPNEDKMNLHLVNIVKERLGPQAMTQVHTHFDDYRENRVMVVRCGKAVSAVFVKDATAERFYVRTGPSTTELTGSQVLEYIKYRFQ